MATSITAAGIVFPDSSVQTTAATAGGGATEAIASGALSDGSKVIVNADGTVSVVAIALVNPPVVGTAAVFESAQTDRISATFDSLNNRVVIAYRDQANSDFGTAIVGTVSGTAISFGTAVVFQSSNVLFVTTTFDSIANKVVVAYQNVDSSKRGTARVGTVSGTSISFGNAVDFKTSETTAISATFDSTAGKVVIAFRDNQNSNVGTAVVGTVSGTSISFGTSVVFRSATTLLLTTTFDSTNNKVVIAYQDQGNANFGTAIVGTVSGTSISFGTAVVFESAGTDPNSATFDSNSNKVVIAYADEGNSSFGTAIVGTVSGTSISFGTAVVFKSQSSSFMSATFDSAANKVVITYQNNPPFGVGNAVVGTVSGTSISFGTEVVFESGNTTNISATFDSTNNKAVIAYTDQGNVNFGTAIVFQNASINLTAENYIGISDAAYTNGQTATIQLVGAVDDAQSGLTAGQAFFVQVDGTLSATPGSPSVFAGTAVSSTKLIIKR